MAVHMLVADTAEEAASDVAETFATARERLSAVSRATVTSIDAIAVPPSARAAAASAVTSAPGASRGRLVGARAGGAVGCPPGSRREGYRLSRWERLGMTIVVTAALVVAAMSLLRPAAPATRLVTVLPGDTMASLVLREVPDMDVARAAELVEDLNGLAGPTVSAGMRLAVPADR